MSQLKVDYNLLQEALRDLTPETMADLNGITQADHNRENFIARNQLANLKVTVRNNRAKISELEKLSIKQQTEIDFIKNTPTNFDLADTELFVDRFGTAQTALNDDGIPSAEIITDLFAPRSDGNFEFGILKNKRALPIGGVDEIVGLDSLFGNEVHDVAFGETTQSLWILTSDGAGDRAYLYRCSRYFVDGRLNILSYWIIEGLGADREFYGIAESYYDGALSLFVAVSDESTSATGGHFINRYEIRYSDITKELGLVDGKELSPGVAKVKTNGDVIDNEVSSLTGTVVEKIDISEPGYLRGLEVVNDAIFVVLQKDSSSSEEEIDNTGYSLIRKVTITNIGVLTSGSNTFKYKLDDIFEDKENNNNFSSVDSTSSPWDVYGISKYKSTPIQAYKDLTQAQVDIEFNKNSNARKFYISAQNRITNEKKIVLIDLIKAENAFNSSSSDFEDGLQNINTILFEITGVGTEATKPFITFLNNEKLIEVVQTSTRNNLAIHNTSGFDIFQGNIKYTSKVKRYFQEEQWHGQLGLPVNAVASNQVVALTAGPDIEYSFVTNSGTRTRSSIGNLFTNSGTLINVHDYKNNEPFWIKPSKTFSISDGTSTTISGVVSMALKGTATSGEALYVSYASGAINSLISVPYADISAASQAGGANGFPQYPILTGITAIDTTAGDIGNFNGCVSYDPVAQQLWVATDKGYIKQIDDAGETLNYSVDNTYKVLKIYPDVSGTITSGVITDGSSITSISVYDELAYVAMEVPNVLGTPAVNTTVRVFDIKNSTGTSPFSVSLFSIKDSVSDISITDTGLFTVDGKSTVKSIHNSQFENFTFESVEVFDEFNFFKNPVINDGTQIGYSVTATEYFERERDSSSFQDKEWILPRRSLIFGLNNLTSFVLDRAKLQVIDYSDVNNPKLWTEFKISDGVSTPIDTTVDGSLLVGSGQIDAVTGVNDKLFIGRRDSGFGTFINVIDFVSNNAQIIVDSQLGNGNIYSGMQFGYNLLETDRTGSLSDANNADYHYSGLINSNIKVGPGRINDMSSALILNDTNKIVRTPFVLVGHQSVNNSGALDIINGNTLESVISIGPGRGNVKKVHLNENGQAIIAIDSGVIYKINDIKLADQDNLDYVTDFSAQKVVTWFPNSQLATNMSDMKVQSFKDTLGNDRNIIFASFGDASGNASMAVKFEFEDVADAGGAENNPDEFLNNAEIIYYNSAESYPITGIDWMDDRVFLSYLDPNDLFRLAILKKFDKEPESGADFSNNWAPILGDGGGIDSYIDYQDLNYTGIKSPIRTIDSARSLNVLFANTEHGSVALKFPYNTNSKWISKVKLIEKDVNAVAVSKDVYIEDGFVSEVIDRNDDRIIYEGAWEDSNSGVVVSYTAGLFNRNGGRKQIRGKLLRANGTTYPVDSYEELQPFTVASDNGLDVFWDGTSITSLGYDFKDNVLMRQRDNNVQIFDYVDVTPTDIQFKPIYQDKQIATVSLNESNATFSFFTTEDASITNSGTVDIISQEYDISDIAQNPVILIRADDGRQLASFSQDENGNDIKTGTLEDVQKAATDDNGSPVAGVVISGLSQKKKGLTTKSVKVTTINFKLDDYFV